MAQFTTKFLNLLIYPFTQKTMFVFIAGILSCTWLFSKVYDMIRGAFKS